MLRPARRADDDGRGRPRRFTSALHDERTAAWLGIALGVTFTICFVTGLWSHLQQNPPAWFDPVARPAGLYRVTQGLHVATGIASIPLLLAKLWVVYPKLFQRPIFTGSRRCSSGSASCRSSAAGSSCSSPGSPTSTSGTRGRSTSARRTTGWRGSPSARSSCTSAPSSRRPAVRSPRAATRSTRPRTRVDRRHSTGAASSGWSPARRAVHRPHRRPDRLAARKLALLAPRRPDTGPQGFPVNRSAVAAGVVTRRPRPRRTDSSSKARCDDRSSSRSTSCARSPHRAVLPIACVEGWSASRRGRRPRARPARAGRCADRRPRPRALAPGAALVRIVRPRPRAGARRRHACSRSRSTGEPLHLDHGYPLRLIGPNRPGVMQTKWVTRLVVVVNDADASSERAGLGFWIGLAVGHPGDGLRRGRARPTGRLAPPFDVAKWLGGGVLLHDLVLAPLVLAVVWAIGRLAPPPVHTAARRCPRQRPDRCDRMAGTPGLRQSPDNPTVHPLDYGTRCSRALVLLWAVVALWVLVACAPASARPVRDHTRNRVRIRSTFCSNISNTPSWVTGATSGPPREPGVVVSHQRDPSEPHPGFARQGGFRVLRHVHDVPAHRRTIPTRPVSRTLARSRPRPCHRRASQALRARRRRRAAPAAARRTDRPSETCCGPASKWSWNVSVRPEVRSTN